MLNYFLFSRKPQICLRAPLRQAPYSGVQGRACPGLFFRQTGGWRKKRHTPQGRSGAAVFVHPWDMLGPERMTNYFLPWLVGMPTEICVAICSLIFGGILERLPHLKIGFSHGGGSFLGTIGRIEKGFLSIPDCQVTCTINPREFLGKFWVDSLVHDEHMLRYLVELFGSSKVVLCSDYPFPLGELKYPGSLIDSTFNDQDSVEAKIKTDLFQNSAFEFRITTMV